MSEQNTERRLATIRRIAAIDPIPGADAIDVATVDGWKVVVKKGEYQVDQLIVFLEIDSWVPETVAPFLSKGRSYNGVVGERLRTVKLRGQVSQGLILPFTANIAIKLGAGPSANFSNYLDDDVTEILGIQKWEKALSANLAGVARGNFPSFIRKTNQERIQNLKRDFKKWQDEGVMWEITEKLDGSSMTVYVKDGQFGVCSRNLDLVETEGNSFWQAANALDLREKMLNYGSVIMTPMKNFAIQGELVGEGIQGNKYGLKGVHFYVFDIFNIDTQEYLGHFDRFMIVSDMNLLHSPFVEQKYVSFDENDTIENILAKADGASLIGNKSAREGLVFKESDGRFSFKAISNKWLLKNEENG